MSQWSRSAALVLAFGFGLIACAERLDTTRVVPERGTLGEEIFSLLHKDFVREDARRADGFLARKDPFVSGIDHLFRPDELRYTQDFLIRLLPLYDDGSLPDASNSIADAMTRLLEDEEAVRALAAVLHRVAYVDLRHEEAIARRVAAYPDYRALTNAIIDLALAHDGLDAEGAPSGEADELRVLQSLLSERLIEAEISEDAERNIVLGVDLLLSEDPRLARRPDPVLIVRRDPRGLARVNADQGQPRGPFVDASPADGLADVDLLGRFVGGDGAVIDLPPFATGVSRDPQGRLTTASGQTVFDYADLDRTLLASLLRDTRALVDDDVTMKAVRSLDVVLGERTEEGRYETHQSPLLDLAHALGHGLDTRQLPDVLELLRVLLEQHEPTLGWLLVELETQQDVADRYPGGLAPNHTFLEDMLEWIRKLLAAPGLAEAVLDTLRDPAVAGITDATVTLARHKKALISEADFDAGNVFVTPVDRTQLDVAGNQSLAQRVFHLIKDTKGAKYEPRIIGIPVGFIFEIDDLAEFYMLSLIGEAQVPGIVSTLTGLSQQPGPVELSRFINSEQTFGNPRGNEGIDVKDNDGDTLYAVSASGMADALAPLVQVFYDHGQLDLLFELLEILHVHWATADSDYQDASPGQPRYSKLTGIAKFEPMLIEIFTEAKVLDAVIRLLDETDAVRVQSGRAAHDLVLTLARQLMTKQTSLRTREGDSSVRIDNLRITPLSPFDLLRFALDGLDDRVDRRARTRAEWDDVTTALTDRFAGVERTGPEAGRLSSASAVPALSMLLAFLEDRARKHDADGDLSPWIRGEILTHAEDALTSRELPALLDVIYAVEADEAVLGPLEDLIDELLDEERGFTDLLVVTGDALEASKDASIAVPLLRYLGRELDPERGHLFKTLDLARRARELDPDEHLLEVARRGLERSPDTHELYLYGLTGTIRQLNRVDPLATGIVDPADLRKVITETRDYLEDDQHGLRKFYDLVNDRKLDNR